MIDAAQPAADDESMIKQIFTIEDLYKYDGPGGAELVNGELVEMSPTGAISNYGARQILRALIDYEERTKSGRAYSDNIAFVVKLSNRQSFSPDASYHLNRKMTAKFVTGAPVFAVEVRSRGDYGPAAERKMAAKRSDYFAAGTLVVWDVDVLEEIWIRSFTHDAPDKPTLFREDEIATVETVLPGFEFAVRRLVPEE